MKNNKKTLNIILFGIIALVAFGAFIMSMEASQGGMIYAEWDREDLTQLVSLNTDYAGLLLAMLCLGIVAWMVRFIMISIPAFKTGIKGNKISILVFDILSIVMLLSTLLGILLPIGQPCVEVMGRPRELGNYAYVLLHMTAYSSPIVLVSSIISGIAYNNGDNKATPINTTLFGVTTALIFSIMMPVMLLVSSMYKDAGEGSNIIVQIDWKYGGVLIAFVLVCMVAQILRFVFVTLPMIKKGGVQGNTAAILVFDIITFVMLIAMLTAIFLPTGKFDATDPATMDIISNRETAARNLGLWAPGIATVTSLISGVVANHSSK